MDNVFGERDYFVDLDDHQEQMMYDQQVVDAKCKSPCPSSAEICIAMCA
jgi:hypothetical protein